MKVPWRLLWPLDTGHLFQFPWDHETAVAARSARVSRPAVRPTGGLQVTRQRSGTGRPAVAEDGRVRRPCPNQHSGDPARTSTLSPSLQIHWPLTTGQSLGWRGFWRAIRSSWLGGPPFGRCPLTLLCLVFEPESPWPVLPRPPESAWPGASLGPEAGFLAPRERDPALSS
jgi:hypothetical protein